jgi:hypothetical protein
MRENVTLLSTSFPRFSLILASKTGWVFFSDLLHFFKASDIF